jgi:hypothetical protein
LKQRTSTQAQPILTVASIMLTLVSNFIGELKSLPRSWVQTERIDCLVISLSGEATTIPNGGFVIQLIATIQQRSAT